MTREQRLRELVSDWRNTHQRNDYKRAITECADELEAILNEESEGWVLNDDKSCAPPNDEWQRGFNRGFELGQKAAPTRPADGSDKS